MPTISTAFGILLMYVVTQCCASAIYLKPQHSFNKNPENATSSKVSVFKAPSMPHQYVSVIENWYPNSIVIPATNFGRVRYFFQVGKNNRRKIIIAKIKAPVQKMWNSVPNLKVIALSPQWQSRNFIPFVKKITPVSFAYAEKKSGLEQDLLSNNQIVAPQQQQIFRHYISTDGEQFNYMWKASLKDTMKEKVATKPSNDYTTNPPDVFIQHKAFEKNGNAITSLSTEYFRSHESKDPDKPLLQSQNGELEFTDSDFAFSPSLVYRTFDEIPLQKKLDF